MFRDTAIAAGLLFAVAAPPLAAQGWIEIERPAHAPVPPNGGGGPGQFQRPHDYRRSCRARRGSGGIQEPRRNHGGGELPLPPAGRGDLLQLLPLWIGDKEVRGETMNAEQARSIYEEIVRASGATPRS